MEQPLEATVALLARTPGALNALLRDLPAPWIHANEGEGTWSVFDVIGHLIHGEHTDWIPRARMVLAYGGSRTFAPFDRQAQSRDSEGKSLHQLLDEFAAARAECLIELRGLNLTEPDLARTGRHPAFGSVTLSQLLATWAAHDLSHLHQIARILAHQYRHAVGPWAKYLGVMQCAGHSE